MKLPNAGRALIPREKLEGYLLSSEHPIGRHKASFFGNLGYARDVWEQLDTDLRAQHLSLDADEQPRSPYGRKFLITGALSGPNGRSAILVSAWMIRDGEVIPRFITAYPGAKE